MVEIIINSITGAMLLVCGLQDIKMKRFYTWIVLLATILIVACIPFSSTTTIGDRLLGSSLGLAVILISILTQGKIGLGDGLILWVTGISLGFWSNLELFMIALLFSAILSIILLVAKKVNRKQCIPFVPFIFMAYIIGRIGI